MNSQVGEGLQSVVQIIEHQGQMAAKKVYKYTVSEKLRQKEIKILKSLKHKNILKIIDHDAEHNYFICEIMKYDLFSLLDKKHQFQIRTVKQILLELSEAVNYLHKLNYVHRDIKLDNIMINDKLEIKLIDFGFAEYIGVEKQFIYCGTINYISPELFSETNKLSGEQLKKSDVFALGVTIFTLLYGFPPFLKATDQCKYWQAIQKQQWALFWRVVNRNKQINDEKFQQLFEKMMSENPNDRCDIEYVLNHPWLDENHDLSQLKQLIN